MGYFDAEMNMNYDGMLKRFWVSHLEQMRFIDLKMYPESARQIRRAISQLRKKGVYFIPIGNYQYKVLSDDIQETDVESYLARETKHLATQYFNTVRPLTQFVKDERKRALYGDLFKIMEELQ